jgi:SpoVK/Ycf46/Vps4 family AAA+-type ATPase
MPENERRETLAKLD